MGSRIGITGRVLGMALRVDEVVTTYEPPWHKVWETVDEPRLLVIGRYRMGFGVEPLGSGSRARWCTQQMLLGIRGT